MKAVMVQGSVMERIETGGSGQEGEEGHELMSYWASLIRAEFGVMLPRVEAAPQPVTHCHPLSPHF